ncbi:MAG: glycosyltransferase [Acidobacteriota bacterium]|nr:glycosyltransferase [Acidobacteriota bacterium]
MKIVRILWSVCIAIFSPVLLLIAGCMFALEDLCFACFGKRRPPVNSTPDHRSASVVIPNWNGRDLLQKFLPSVIDALRSNPENELIVVDNASTDGSVEFLRENFPRIRVLAQERNLGFGGGSNAGFQAAKNDVVVLLNNDMRVEPDFLAPLLAPFADPLVFSVACQIFFSDPAKRREETGLTQTWWERGRLRVSHRIDPVVDVAFPCAYSGGGSSAFNRRKFQELGGFDEIYKPFYYEDTDLGHLAWKRGWKVLYEPRSVVFHEHRGTIGKSFTPDFIETVLKKNLLLFCWKNIHNWRMLANHLFEWLTVCIGGTLTAHPQGRHASFGLLEAVLSLPKAMKARWHAREFASVSDSEIFRRQRGSYYRDRFETQTPVSGRLQVLFASPYPIEPPIHGGAVLMRQTLEELAPLADVHLVSFVDEKADLPKQEKLHEICASAQFLVRGHRPFSKTPGLLPTVIREFEDPEFAWALDRTIFLKKVDVVQMEYTLLGQYVGDYRRIPWIIFEHDLAFQSLARRLKGKPTLRLAIPYMQLLRYESNMVKQFARVQVCSEENARYLLEFVPEIKGRVDSDLRAIIQSDRYEYAAAGREPETMLFLGSFRHAPNVQALTWFIDRVFPQIVRQRSGATLVIAGSGSSEILGEKLHHPNIRVLGFVEDAGELLRRNAIMLCPILSGSGVRVKLLEGFASGIPVVSTTLGAEGLTCKSGEICELADSPEDFAASVVRLLEDPGYASELARRARLMVETEKDAKKATARLVQTYRLEIERRRPPQSSVKQPAREETAATAAGHW